MYTFTCIDAHTCGNPVRLVISGAPDLIGKNINEKRQHFLKEFDWIRKGLMFEPRGHDQMSGSILFPPHHNENDAAVLFIETSGCLPMCGHGTIGTVTIAVEKGLIKPKTKGLVRLETPAGLVSAEYRVENGKVKSVKITNVISFLHSEGLKIDCPGLGNIVFDVAYGGNFYAIIDIQPNYKGLEYYTAGDLVSWGRTLRQKINEEYSFIHPENESIRGCTHIMWTGIPMDTFASARNAVLYGDKAIDRSPCGTGTSARMAQWYSKGKLFKGDKFIHESIIGSQFIGTIAEETNIEGFKAIRPAIEGWAKIYGHNEITIDPDDDPYAFGFQVI